MRCTRLSRYSGVISSADSRRMPRSILAIISRCSLMAGASSTPAYRGASAFLDHPHRLALGAGHGARGDQAQLHAQPDGAGQAVADAAAQIDERGVAGVEAAAALHQG